jgi:hypothetical protein
MFPAILMAVGTSTSTIFFGLAGLICSGLGVSENPRSVRCFVSQTSPQSDWTDYYYNAYPMASSNDIKSAKGRETPC